MRLYGLVGKKLDHSFSPDYFSEKFRKLKVDAEYKLFEIDDVNEIIDIINENPNLAGLNITIPYKQKVMGIVDEIDHQVQITGSINTIKVIRKRNSIKLRGYNTDIIGFEKTLKPLIKGRNGLKAMILGTGGSSGSVAYVLRKNGVLFCYASREPSNMLHLNYDWIDKIDMHSYRLIINTTPLGMYPNVNEAPNIPFECITDNHILYDLVYNPVETLFLRKGNEMGATIMNGQKMLEIQADASWKIWNKRWF
jgi:shikimate dehydrogenase